MRYALIVFGIALAAGCQRQSHDAAQDRTAAIAAAEDTARRQWQHAVGVDSVQTRGDTLVVRVSPRKWTATDAPQAAVRVLGGGRIIAIQWIMGG